MSTFPSLSTPLDTLNATRGAEVRASVGDISKLQTAEDTDKVAKKFEALLIHNMLKAMRSTSLGEEPSNERAMYNDMFDQELSKVMSESGRLGIAQSIRQQLNAQNGISETKPPQTLQPLNEIQDMSLSELDRRRQEKRINQLEQMTQLSQLEMGVSAMSNDSSTLAMNGQLTQALSGDSSSSTTGSLINSMNSLISRNILKELEVAQQNSLRDKREGFIHSLMPDAKRSAERLGVAPQVVIAIAALETGWGKHVMKDNNGISSNNLFGIKRHGQNIPYTQNKTTEFVNNEPITVDAEFRRYNSTSQSVDDFATFILSNPRYQSALDARADNHAFLNELQRAGYATDPEYAAKAINVLNQIESIQQGPAL